MQTDTQIIQGDCLEVMRGVAAKMLGRNFVGIEREPDYVKIAEARIAAVVKESLTAPPAPTVKQSLTVQSAVRMNMPGPQNQMRIAL